MNFTAGELRITSIMPGGPSKNRSSHPSTHMSLRIQKKIAQFDQIIAGFRQRRWA